MTHFRWRWSVRGNHVHVQLFAGSGELATHAQLGTLTLSIAEWEALRDSCAPGLLNGNGELVAKFQFVEET